MQVLCSFNVFYSRIFTHKQIGLPGLRRVTRQTATFAFGKMATERVRPFYEISKVYK